jgi:RNA polymerase sigma factor (TIGR02999 family)
VSEEKPITLLLARAARGDRDVDAALALAVVERLEQIASREMAVRNNGGLHGLTIEPAMLAHDALLKILEQPQEFENRRHFFAYATQIMANAMISHLRRRNAAKRGGGQIAVTLSAVIDSDALDFELDEMPAALKELEALDRRKADLVGLRVFWGASMEEAAELLGVSLSSAERDWRFARRWLAARLSAAAADSSDATPQ